MQTRPAASPPATPENPRGLFATTPLARRRWSNFVANRRGFFSLWILLALMVITLFAEFIANDKPILVSYKGEILAPILIDYPEAKFGGRISCHPRLSRCLYHG